MVHKLYRCTFLLFPVFAHDSLGFPKYDKAMLSSWITLRIAFSHTFGTFHKDKKEIIIYSHAVCVV